MRSWRSKEVLDPVTIIYLPPKKYPTGTLTFEHTFPENGKFIGIVTVRNEHGQTFVSQFPFAVGQPVGRSLVLYGFLAAVGLGAVYGLWHYGGKQKRRSPLCRKAPREELLDRQ